MAEVTEAPPCSNPGCDQPGTKSCSACKIAVYCSVSCQTADWAHHKEECDGHLRKVGKAHLTKASGFHRQQKWMQALPHAEIAATKLKQLKDRRLETVQILNDALGIKFDAFLHLSRNREAHECIKECYTMNHMRNPGSMRAALGLIESCIHNREYEDAEHYARHAYFMIAEMTDNFIPSDQRSHFLADASHWLAQAILFLAKSGGIPSEGKKKAGEEAIEHASKALELQTQVHGTESAKAADSMGLLAEVLSYFHDFNDNEVLRLFEQSISTFGRVESRMSVNVAVNEYNLGNVYQKRAKRAVFVNDLDRCQANSEMALSHYRESVRIYRAINHVDKADEVLPIIGRLEELIHEVGICRAAAAAAETRG